MGGQKMPGGELAADLRYGKLGRSVAPASRLDGMQCPGMTQVGPERKTVKRLLGGEGR